MLNQIQFFRFIKINGRY